MSPVPTDKISTDLSGTVSTLEDMDGQASHKRRKNLIKLFKVLQCIEDQSFLCCLMSLTLVIAKLFTKEGQVARFKHNLVKSKTDGLLEG